MVSVHSPRPREQRRLRTVPRVPERNVPRVESLSVSTAKSLQSSGLANAARSVHRQFRRSEFSQAQHRRKEVKAWKSQGRPNPTPSAVKITEILGYVERFRPRVFIETGTFRGDTTEVVMRHVDKLWTIELSPRLASLARVKFAAAPHVEVVEGDSGVLLPEILEGLWEPALFWLDGHWSDGDTARGELDTPLRAELDAILSHRVADHVVLIDDARLFGNGDYPSIAEVEASTRASRPDWDFEVRHDIIRAHPRPAQESAS